MMVAVGHEHHRLCRQNYGNAYELRILHLAPAHPMLSKPYRTSPRHLKQGLVSSGGIAEDEAYSPVISSGNIESRTSRSSICSSRPIFPFRKDNNNHLQPATNTPIGLSEPSKRVPLYQPFTLPTFPMPPPKPKVKWLSLGNPTVFFFTTAFLGYLYITGPGGDPPAVRDALMQRRRQDQLEQERVAKEKGIDLGDEEE